MKKTIHSVVDAKIAKLGKDLADFRRKNRTRKRYPPEEIWNRAIALCDEAPLGAVAQGILVSEQGLRNRIKSAKSAKRQGRKPVRAGFMEISPAALASASAPQSALTSAPDVKPSVPPFLFSSSAAPMVELERRDGLKLRVQLPSHGLSLAHLLGQFMGVSS